MGDRLKEQMKIATFALSQTTRESLLYPAWRAKVAELQRFCNAFSLLIVNMRTIFVSKQIV
jgi:hypothetical protein